MYFGFGIILQIIRINNDINIRTFQVPAGWRDFQ